MRANLGEMRGRLAEAQERERRFGRMALQDGITPKDRMVYRQLQLSARAEAKLAQKAVDHAMAD
jgi:hypothetical protein